jgi:plasmid maintenance system antidote protein VapI
VSKDSKDLKSLRALVGEAMSQLSHSSRALEEELEIGHGNLSHLLAGRLELKVRHILSLARLVGVPPHRFLELGCPEALKAARRDVTELMAKPPGTVHVGLLTQKELEDHIRAIVREEMARKGDPA